MSSVLMDDMTVPWTAVGAGFTVSADTIAPHTEAPGSNLLELAPGSSGDHVRTVLTAPLDLTEYDEIRFWVRAHTVAAGTRQWPFLLQFEYDDVGDLPTDEHRWFIPVNRADRWEQRRIGIEQDRRSQVTELRIRTVSDQSVNMRVSEVLATRGELLVDAEFALHRRLASIRLPGLENLGLAAPVVAGAVQVDLVGQPDIQIGNVILLEGGDAGPEERTLTGVNVVGAQTTVSFAEPLLGNYALAMSTASLIVPVLFERPAAAAAMSPMLIATSLDAREDLRQSLQYQQRDSFRSVNGAVHASVRPAPRVYMLDYQLTVLAARRREHQYIHVELLRRLSRDMPLRIAGAMTPIEILAPPELPKDRPLGLAAPVYLRIYAPLEQAPRAAVPMLDEFALAAAPFDPDNPLAPSEFERIRIEL